MRTKNDTRNERMAKKIHNNTSLERKINGLLIFSLKWGNEQEREHWLSRSHVCTRHLWSDRKYIPGLGEVAPVCHNLVGQHHFVITVTTGFVEWHAENVLKPA